MRAPLAIPVLMLLSLCAACGSVGASDSPGTHPLTTTTRPGEPTLLGLYSGTAGGGTHLGQDAIDVTGKAARDDVVSDLRPPFDQKVATAIDAVVVPSGQRLYAGVVDIGCGTPADATIAARGDGVGFDAIYHTTPPPECFAAVTTIGLALVPENWAGAAPAP